MAFLLFQQVKNRFKQLKRKLNPRSTRLTVNLEEQVVTDNEGLELHFDIPAYPKEMLLNGWDEIGVTLNYEDKITEYELAHK